jgi:hypothetical protein
VDVRLDRVEPGDGEGPLAYLTIAVTSPDARVVGKRFSAAVIEMALATVPGFTATAPPEDARPLVVQWPALVSSRCLQQTVVLDSQPFVILEERPSELALVGAPEAVAAAEGAPHDVEQAGELTLAPLGRVFGARSGDKGGNANLGVWATTPSAFAFLRRFLTVEKLTEILPSTAGLSIERCELPNLLAVNFVIKGLLGAGAGASSRIDPQAKTLGEVFRARAVEMPAALLRERAAAAPAE